MWEILHEKKPFDGDIKVAIQYVVQEDSRPRILTMDMTSEHASMRQSMCQDQQFMLTEGLANIIRRCW